MHLFKKQTIRIIITFLFIHKDLIPPSVTIETKKAQMIGESYNMTYNVNVLGLLIPNTVIQWTKTPPNNTIPSSNAGTTSLHYIEALNTSDAGLYTCIATIKLPDIGITVQGNYSHITALKSKMMEYLLIPFSLVPQPSVSVSLSTETDLLAGSSLNITCSITIDPRVNTPVNIMAEWVANNGVVINGVNQYQSVLYITSLSSVKDDMYQCKVNVNSASDYVTEADTTSDVIIFNVSSMFYNECT